MVYDSNKIFRNFLFFMTGFFIGSGLQSCFDDSMIRRQAIEHNYAQYNNQTGEWEWMEIKP